MLAMEAARQLNRRSKVRVRRRAAGMVLDRGAIAALGRTSRLVVESVYLLRVLYMGISVLRNSYPA